MKEIVLASSNKGKIKEFIEIFKQKNISIIPQTKFNISDAEETGLSFIENAIIKARHCSKNTGLPAIADDSGLEVFSLAGDPGIYSARYAGEHGNDDANIQKLLTNLKNHNNRTARFVCALAYVRNETDPTPIVEYGFLDGEITHSRSGEYGFGYDPVFFLPNLQKTLAELPNDKKNRISHRAIALSKIINKI